MLSSKAIASTAVSLGWPQFREASRLLRMAIAIHRLVCIVEPVGDAPMKGAVRPGRELISPSNDCSQW